MVGAAQRVDRVDDPGLVRDHLLRAQRQPHRVLGRQRQRLVVRVRVQRLRAAEHRRERLDRRPRDVDERLLPGQRHPRGLRVEAHQQRTLVAGAVGVAQLARPDPSRRPVLRDLLEEVEVRVEEERQPWRERVHVEPPLERPLHVGEPVLECERELLRRRRAGLADVVAGDRDRMPQRHLSRAELDHVGHEPHRRLRREDELLLRDVLLEDVRLDRPPQPVARHPLLLPHDQVHRKSDRRRRVDRHRCRHLAQRYPREQDPHVLERRHRHALAADLAHRPRRVRVDPHQRRHVERARQSRLPVLEQVAKPLVRLLRRPEPRELPHRPQTAPVHRRIHPARERERARVPEVPLVVHTCRLGRCQRLHL